MRITGGEMRGRIVEVPRSDAVRPTQDRVREALFNILAPEMAGAEFLDLFAGSGAIGIEALSRGAKRVYFGDVSKESIELTKRNCRTVGCSNDAIFFLGEWRRVLARVAEEAKGKVDVVFIDPPYKAGIYEEVLAELARLELPSEDAILMLEHDPSSWRRKIIPDGRAQLTLSGHTHKMQLTLFGWCPLTVTGKEVNGWYTEGSQSLFVTAGLGGLIPFRFGATGEIVVLTLKKSK